MCGSHARRRAAPLAAAGWRRRQPRRAQQAGPQDGRVCGASPEQQQLAALFESALEVSCTPAHQKEDLELGKLEKRSAMMLQPPAVSAAPKKVEVGTYLGRLLRLPRAGIPPVVCALLSQQEAAEAVAPGARRPRQWREAWRSHTSTVPNFYTDLKFG